MLKVLLGSQADIWYFWVTFPRGSMFTHRFVGAVGQRNVLPVPASPPLTSLRGMDVFTSHQRELASRAACSPGLSISPLQKLHLGTLTGCTSCKLFVPPPTASNSHRTSTRDHKTANHRSRSHHLSHFCLPAPQTTQSPTEFKRSQA